MNGHARRLRCTYSGFVRLWPNATPDPVRTSVRRPQILTRDGLVCPITGFRREKPVSSFIMITARSARRLVVPGVDLAWSPRWRANGREPSRDVSRRARAPRAWMRGRRRRAARPNVATRDGWAVRDDGIDRRPGGTVPPPSAIGWTGILASRLATCARALARMRGRRRRAAWPNVGEPCATAASIGAPAVPRWRCGDDSAGPRSRRGPAGTLGGRGGAGEAMAAPSAAIAVNNFIVIELVNPYFKIPPRIPT